ncbi:hypothetical protein [uncultured Tateyamaria sp.]|uniref:hypothetical protein n=1 Tax=uncultured Tateyamaria sp. TaxID=455651 RepID=UPI00262AFBC7|nr:hypothetical protein [uncultured Tateyamaria sp.]
MNGANLAQRAGMLCNDVEFRRFVAERTIGQRELIANTAAAEHLRQVCGIDSRKKLNTDTVAAQKFEALRTEFDAWRGRIGQPR